MGKPLVIVESPAKARTISNFLGDEFEVAASVGHIRDLPGRASEIPERYRALPWARTAVDVDNDFQPLYVLTERGREQVKKLKPLLKAAPMLYLATDEDREGEAIAWHLQEVLKPKVPVKRLVFHEITRSAIQQALDNARDLDMDLVQAQETRRIVDRLYGYNLSPVLWRKIRPKLSAGRVQSVAVRLLVEREAARRAFRSGSWWDIIASLQAQAEDTPVSWNATLIQVGARRLATSRDFDPDTGQLKRSSAALLLDQAAADALKARLALETPQIASVEQKPFTSHPSPPFITSTLQQEANRRLRWSARRTMTTAQSLYENGWITYMRTDSTSLAAEALKTIRALIQQTWGASYLPSRARTYRTRAKSAQEAHEAIRPAGSPFRSVADCRREMGEEAAQLYELIWNRTIACQMVDAQGVRVVVDTQIDDALFRASGRTLTFAGYQRVYSNTSSDDEQTLPPVQAGDTAAIVSLTPVGHQTQPPGRLSEASLVKELEARGIGRPSTYASIIETIVNRGYVFKRGTTLIPTWTAFAVTNLMEQHFSNLVDYDFTAQLEGGLDTIAEGQLSPTDYLNAFYRGQEDAGGLIPLIEQAQESADPRSLCSIQIGERAEQPIVLRVGRYGPYIAHGETTRSLPDQMAPDELTLERANTLLDETPDGPRELGEDPVSGLKVYAIVGRFGPYVQLGEQESTPKGKTAPKPKRESLLRDMKVDEIDLATALRLLSLPRTLGQNAEGVDITAQNGRYGPYIKCGRESRSIPAQVSVLDITLEQANELLAQPSARSRGASVLKELGQDDQQRTISLKSGRYGPYVTDGETNANLKRGTDPDTVTFEEALQLLAARRAAPARKKKKKATRKKPATKRRSSTSSTT